MFFGKTDLSSAFRVLPLKRSCICWLIFKARDPKDGKFKYFIEKCLPFGASISCSHYQRFSNALKHILQYRVGKIGKAITNYLDDFLFQALCRIICNDMICEFLNLCREINLPVAIEKMEWACMILVFLGILLNGEYRTLSIPLVKQKKALHLLNDITGKNKITVQQLQMLTSYLNFLTKAIFAGRTFTRHMYAKYAELKQARVGNKLKPHYHIRIDGEFRLDCEIWRTFLSHHSELSLCRPMVDLCQTVSAWTLCFYSDASANAKLGFRAVYNNQWLFAQWEPRYIEECQPSIEYLELLALTAAVPYLGKSIKKLQDHDLL